jgi:hypothetical protein
LFSWLILHRTPGEVAWIGAACVLVGVVLTQTQGLRHRPDLGPNEEPEVVIVPAAPVLVEVEEA